MLLVILAAGLGTGLGMPKQLGYQPVGINLELPDELGKWLGNDEKILEKERQVLGLDTEFSRKSYRSFPDDTIRASVVLAGQDMMTGIHRPERCLEAQGWTVTAQGSRQVPMPGGSTLEVRRLHNSKMVKAQDGRPLKVNHICYYWFVGYTETTSRHTERVWIDSRDRLLKGHVQRWAMVMIASDISRDRDKFGRDERQTDALLDEFVATLAPKIHKESVQLKG
jgi:EpsI family protein